MINLASVIKKPDSLPRVSSDVHISKILPLTKSSHDGILVFSPGGNFLGMISVYHLLYRHRPKTNSTIRGKHISRSHITSDMDIFDVIAKMVNFRLYHIPVLDDTGNLTGLVSAKNIIRKISQDPTVLQNLQSTIRIKPPVTVDISSKIKDIYSTMRKKHRSRMIVVSEKNKLEGVISRRDIYLALLSPGQRGRLRRQGGRKNSAFFDRNWPVRLDYPIKTFMSRPVQTTPAGTPLSKSLKMLAESNTNSIILIDDINRPKGVLTVREVLLGLLELKSKYAVPVIISDRRKILDAFTRQSITQSLEKFSLDLTRRFPVIRSELVIDVIKSSGRTAKKYLLSLTIKQNNDQDIIVKANNYNLHNGLKACQKRILRKIQ